MGQSLTTHLVVPVANEADARATARSLEEYPHGEVTVVHVVEKAGGAPDELSLEQAEEVAEESFAAFREVMSGVEAELVCDEDVVDFAVAVGGSAIAFRPRGGSRLVRLPAGTKALKPVTNPDLPVVAPTDIDAEDG